MQRWRSRLSAWFLAERAATSIEYALMLALVVAVVGVAVVLLGRNVRGVYTAAQSTTAGSGSSSPSSTSVAPVFADLFSDPVASAAKWDFSGSGWHVADGGLKV